MSSVLRPFHAVKSAAKLSDVKMEQEPTIVLFPSIYTIIIEISFHFHGNDIQKTHTNNAILKLAVSLCMSFKPECGAI